MVDSGLTKLGEKTIDVVNRVGLGFDEEQERSGSRSQSAAAKDKTMPSTSDGLSSPNAPETVPASYSDDGSDTSDSRSVESDLDKIVHISQDILPSPRVSKPIVPAAQSTTNKDPEGCCALF